MEVELFVYGVPNGEGFWGDESDRKYFGLFYDNSLDEMKYLIQTRQLNGKKYCYYHYLRYKDVVDVDSRSGSYIGVSLRVDAYCKDIMRMYHILDTAYNGYIYGNLIKKERSKLKYKVSDFKNAQGVLDEMKRSVFEIFKRSFSNDDFVTLEGFNFNSTSVANYNLYDCSPENIQASVMKYGKVALSPYYQGDTITNLEKQCQTQIQTIKQQCEKQLAASSNALSTANRNMEGLKNEINAKNSTITQLNASITQLQTELQKFGKGKNIEQLIGSIKDPISKLSSELEQIVPSKPSKNNGKGVLGKINKIIPILSLLLLLILLLTVFFNPFKMKRSPVVDGTLVEEVKQLKEQCETKWGEIDNQLDIIRAIRGGSVSGVVTQGNFTDNNVEVKLNIEPYSGGPLRKHTTYTVEALSGVGDKNYWNVTGCQIEITSNPNMIKITPTEDNIKIEYKYGKENNRNPRILVAN